MSAINELSANSIRVLAADMVDECGSGHPGMPMGMAALAHSLLANHMNYDGTQDKWLNRDRFLLSNGHGCALQYIMLHLGGYPSMTMDQLRNLRKYQSLTPGHPEAGHTAGVEVTTGPLGQGIANAVGLAWASANLAANYNKDGFPIINNFTYCFAGDGCMQEGVASEASSLAGHWKLPHLILFYDNNKVTIDGATELSFSEDVPKRYEAYGWQVLTVDNADSDFESIDAAIVKAKQLSAAGPVLINCHTTIGYASERQGTAKAHGEALGKELVKKLKSKLGFEAESKFVVPPAVYQLYSEKNAAKQQVRQQWEQLYAQYAVAHPESYQQLQDRLALKMPPQEQLLAKMPKFTAQDKANATRNVSEVVLNVVADNLHYMVGGSADLTGSNKTALKKGSIFSAENKAGNYIHYGIREHGMMAINNGIYAFGGFLPFSSTFLNFITYSFPSLRLASLSHFRNVYILTHDSIGLGEDGPTHQPIEVLALLRATPNLAVYRPADGNETVGAYLSTLYQDGSRPSAIILSRQNLRNLAGSCAQKAQKGGYVVFETEPSQKPELVYVATGSEVQLAIDAAEAIVKQGAYKAVRVVSLPSLNLFNEQSIEYKREVLPAQVPIFAIEVQSSFGWNALAHYAFAMNSFGMSAPETTIYSHFGFTADKIAANTQQVVSQMKASAAALGAPEAFPLLPVHMGIKPYGPC